MIFGGTFGFTIGGNLETVAEACKGSKICDAINTAAHARFVRENVRTMMNLYQ
jgi:hypothetical protein